MVNNVTPDDLQKSFEELSVQFRSTAKDNGLVHGVSSDMQHLLEQFHYFNIKTYNHKTKEFAKYVGYEFRYQFYTESYDPQKHFIRRELRDDLWEGYPIVVMHLRMLKDGVVMYSWIDREPLGFTEIW